jgi:branched-chain amino acid transport system substrate-binding protein
MRKLFYIFVVMAIFSLGPYSVCAQDTVKIGLILPFSGPLALGGVENYQGMQIAADIQNEQGGVFGKKIELVKGDAVDPKAGMAEAERFITVEGLKILMGTYSSSISLAATEVAERHKVIYWDCSSTGDEIVERGFKYLFKTMSVASIWGQVMGDYVGTEVCKRLKIEPKKLRVAVVHEDSLFGTSVAKSFADRLLKDFNVTPVLMDSYSFKVTDLSSLIMRLKAANPDILYAVSYVNDGVLLVKQAKQLNFNVKAFVGGGGAYNTPDWAKTLGKDSDYVLSVAFGVDINPKARSKEGNMIAKEFVSRHEKKFGKTPLTNESLGFSGAWFLFHYALPKAGSTDPERIRQVALELDIPPEDTVFGMGCKFAPPGHPKAGLNLRDRPLITQWFDTKSTVVSPEKLALGQLKLPMPTWEQRKK